MNWTQTKPTTPGRYWWCDGKGGEVVEVAVAGTPGTRPYMNTFTGRGEADRFTGEGGYWSPVVPPQPYVAPKPPEVEWFTGVFRGDVHLIQKCCDVYITFVGGKQYYVIKDDLDLHGYTEVRPCQP